MLNSLSRHLWGKLLLVLALAFFIGGGFHAQQTAQAVGPFVNANIPLTGLNDGDVEWIDFDGDDDLDVFIMGNQGASLATQIWRNTGGVFADIGAGLPGLTTGDAEWGDYDLDGDPDLLLNGWTGAIRVTQIWRNDGGGTFVNSGITLPGLNNGSVDWGDYDNDGDPDILVAGWTGSQRVTQIWYNDRPNNTFVNSNISLTGVENGVARWGDYDSDGDLDIVLAGWTGAQRVTQLWRNGRDANQNVVFTQVNTAITGVDSASLAWGDFDNDSDLDILLAGKTNTGRVTQIWRNDGGSFIQFATPITGVENGTSVDWGDYDNDGDLDILVSGRDGNNFSITQIWRNDVTFFNNFVVNVTGVTGSSVDWGDYDNDGKLDLILSGFNGINRVTEIWRNQMPIATNTPPTPPTNLNVEVVGQGAVLSWTAGTDAQTPQNGLFYNVRIGTTPNGSQVTSAMANTATGYRFIPALGNAQATYRVQGLTPNTTYYWTVQSIDTAYRASSFQIEGNFTTPPYQLTPIEITGVASGASVDWGDYDNDNDLDLLVAGFDGGNRVTQIWRNDSPTSFVQVATGITGVIGGDAAWGDYDNDNDLDVALSGLPNTGRVTEVWRNNGNNTFTKINVNFTAVSGGALVWGDYNRDGRLDLVISGDTGTSRVTQIWRNTGNDTFQKAADLPGVIDSSFAWGDYDNDNDLDLLMAGRTVDGRTTVIMRNTDGMFAAQNVGLAQVAGGEVAFGDYDNDGDLDVLLSGDTASGRTTRIYRNDNGIYTNINATLAALQFGSVAWGDYDNDGDLDVVVSGQEGQNANDPRLTRIYRNDGLAGFTDIGSGLIGLSLSDVAFGDYDNDSDLDIVLAGWTGTQRVTQIWRNDGGFPANAPPAAPALVTAEVTANSARLIWNAPADDRTPANGLSYNVRIGNLPMFTNTQTPMANPMTGYRKIVALGNAQDNLGQLSFTIQGLDPNRTYYWAVQAIDSSFAGGAFSAEGTLTTSPGTDALAVFNENTGQVTLMNTIADAPPASAYNTYTPGAPIQGKWVMGDWDANGERSPGVFNNGAFYFTNDIGPTANWTGIWLGPAGIPISGRFDTNFANDCIGVIVEASVNLNNVPTSVFVMYYSCVLTTNVPPISYQWLSAVLPNPTFSGTHQFASGDFNADGLDTIAVRRGEYIAFTNVAPASNNANNATFDLAQFWGTPPGSVAYGVFTAGDWNNNNTDGFGVLYDNNEFFYRNSVEWNPGTYLNQSLTVGPVGNPRNLASWTPGGSSTPIVASSGDLGQIEGDLGTLTLDEMPSQAATPTEGGNLSTLDDGLGELQPLTPPEPESELQPLD